MYFENVLRIADEILSLFKKNTLNGNLSCENFDGQRIIELSNQMIHDSSIFQKKILVKFSTLLYCIGKMINRQKCRKDDSSVMAVFNHFNDGLKKIRVAISKKNDKEMDRQMNKIFDLISKNDSKFNIYVQDMIHSTMVKKSSQLIDHGLSVETVSDMTGLSQWDLYSYLGKTKIETVLDESINKTERRIRYTKKLFNLK